MKIIIICLTVCLVLSLIFLDRYHSEIEDKDLQIKKQKEIIVKIDSTYWNIYEYGYECGLNNGRKYTGEQSLYIWWVDSVVFERTVLFGLIR